MKLLNIKPKYQRIFYIIPSLVFIYISIAFNDILPFVDYFRMLFKYLIIFGIVIFIYQSILNNVLGWILVMCLYFIYLFIILFFCWLCMVTISFGNDITSTFIIIFFALVYLLIGYVYFSIIPSKKEKD